MQQSGSATKGGSGGEKAATAAGGHAQAAPRGGRGERQKGKKERGRGEGPEGAAAGAVRIKGLGSGGQVTMCPAERRGREGSGTRRVSSRSMLFGARLKHGVVHIADPTQVTAAGGCDQAAKPGGSPRDKYNQQQQSKLALPALKQRINPQRIVLKRQVADSQKQRQSVQITPGTQINTYTCVHKPM